jgi:hypothetical protein
MKIKGTIRDMQGGRGGEGTRTGIEGVNVITVPSTHVWKRNNKSTTLYN